jgi:hypothetical protein
MPILNEADTRREFRIAYLREQIKALSEGEDHLRRLADRTSKLRYEFEQELLALVKEKGV